MDKGNNVTQTFVGDVKTTFVENNESNNVPNYFWTNDDEKTILDYQLNLEKENYKSGAFDGNNFDKHQETIVSNKTISNTIELKETHDIGIKKLNEVMQSVLDDLEDVVNKPKHYNTEVFPQAIDMMLQMFGKNDVLAFCKLNAFKYRIRCGLKHSEIDKKISDNPRKEKKRLKKRKALMVQDIEKAMWYENKYKELNTNSSDEKQILKG